MGSMFEEMKKVKKHLRDTQSEKSKQETNQTSHHARRARIEVCPSCGREVPLDALKKHLVRVHGVAERTSLSDAMAMLSGGRINAQQLYRENGAPSSLAPRSEVSAAPQLKRDRKSTLKQPNGKVAKKARHGLDRNKDLSGYAEKVIQLPTGGTHVIYVKRSGPGTKVSAQTRLSNAPSRGDAHGAARKPAPSSKRSKPPVSPVQPTSLATRSFRLARPNEFKLPDDWVGLGSEVTLSTAGKAHTVYMGIDFGTAYTKSSIGFGGDIFVVDWAGVKAGPEKFTLPGEFSVLPDRSCILGRSPHAIRVASDLKLPFLEGHASKSSLIDATVFLALIMRYVRAWWFHRHSGLVRNRSLEWNINLGAPTTPWQDNAIRAKYERAAKAAWMLSVGSAPISADHAEGVLERVRRSPDEGLPPVEIVPEFVAQIASYTRSPQRQPDLHMLVDVGAGTVDVVTFNVHRDDQTGEDRFPIFWASVSNLGTHYLMACRLHTCSPGGDGHWDDTSSVPSSDQFSQATGIASQEIRRIDHAHTANVANAIASVLRTTKQQRYRRSPNWKAGIRVFLCGGGSSCDVFEQAVTTAARLSGVPLPRIRLPLPERLKAQDLPQDQFHRVSVAYGLGMDAFNLGQIISMAEVEDDGPVPMPVRAHFDWDDG